LLLRGGHKKTRTRAGHKSTPPRFYSRQGSSALMSGFGEPHPHSLLALYVLNFGCGFNSCLVE